MGTFEIRVRKTDTELHTVNADSFTQAKALYLEGAATLKGDENTDIHGIMIESPDGVLRDFDEIETPEDRPTDPIEFLRSMINAWPQFDNDEEVNGGDLVEWFDAAREWAKGIVKAFDLSKAKAKSLAEASEELTTYPCEPVADASDEQMADAIERLEPESMQPVGDFVVQVVPVGAKFAFTARAEGSYLLRVNNTITRAYYLQRGKTFRDEVPLVPGRRHRIAIDFQSKTSPLTIVGEATTINVPMPPPPSSLTAPLAPFEPSKPMAFEYFEVLPCLENYDGGVDYFRTEEEREAAARALHPQVPRMFYTLYGIYSGDAGECLSMAIGDFTLKSDALEVMNAILAPMAKARDRLIEGKHRADRSASIGAALSIYSEIANAACAGLEDFINQCSNEERA